ncbi:hypothetical protein [Aliterella atlantica]|nr:hypothetical protein [Aliterella atlantica]
MKETLFQAAEYLMSAQRRVEDGANNVVRTGTNAGYEYCQRQLIA